MNTLNFRKLTESDQKQVAKIYSEGLDTGNATFETSVPNWNNWNNGHLSDFRIVAEVSLYVSKEHTGQKIGTKLLKQFILESENIGIWTLQAGVSPENIGSIKIHKKLNFREVGFREKIGKLNGVLRNTILLERRSKNTGIE